MGSTGPVKRDKRGLFKAWVIEGASRVGTLAGVIGGLIALGIRESIIRRTLLVVAGARTCSYNVEKSVMKEAEA